ncbi:MAG: hypothetical protein LBC69_01995 [Eubacteriaceae bacterium]|nr:hypothetical protein [Eubacteriaceae bacterium]
MVNLFCGQNGSGKTQKLISHANAELERTEGLIVFIDKSDKRRLLVSNRIKFVNAKEYGLDSTEAFYGFICGVISGNYDINRIYIDNLKDIVKASTEGECNDFVGRINELSEKYQVEFFITLTTEKATSTQVMELVYNG